MNSRRSFVHSRFGFALSVSVAAVVAAAAAPSAYAQTASTIRGTVEGAPAGTAVTVTDTFTGRSVTGQTDEGGTYVIVGLRPSSYRVEVEGRGAQDITVPVGETATVNFVSETPAAAGQEIVVTGSRSRTEVRTATVTTNVTQAQIENLPQNDRNFLNFAALAPGVSVSPSSGSRRIQAGAVSGDRTNVFVDGLSLKNPINHGGVAGQNFSRGNPFPQLAVQEFKVDTQNFKAEFEQSGSAIITAVTKTGGADFHGDAFAEWQPKSFIGRPYFDRPGNANNPDGDVPKPDYNRWQFGADLGGPIIRDKLHFFAAYEGTRQTLPSASVLLKTTDGVPADIASQFNGSYGVSFDQDLLFGKLTAFVTEDDTVNASWFHRRENELTGIGGNAAPSHASRILSDVDVYQADWSHRGDDWLNEFTLAYNTVVNGTPRITEGPQIILTPTEGSFDTIAQLGAAGFYQNDDQKTWTIKNNTTLTRGDHVIKFGAKVAFNKYGRIEDNQSNGTYFFFAPDYTGFDASIPTGARISTVAPQYATAKNTQIGLFAQDDWTIDDHWTINAGIRWDYETNATNVNFVTPEKVANALRNYEGWKAAGIDPDDYISTGDNRDPTWKMIQPRIGVSYDVFGDRDLIIFAGAGRYYDRPLFITAAIETLKNYYESVSTLSFCNPASNTAPNLTACPAAPPAGTIAWDPSYRDVDQLRAAAVATGLGGDVWLLNNETKSPYSDQFNIGVRKRFGDIQTAITFSHIRSHNIFQFVRGNRYSNGWWTRVLEYDAAGNVIGCHDGGDTWIQDAMPDVDYAACPATDGDLAGFNGKLNIGRNDGSADYNAIYITAQKPFTESTNWGFSAALTLQSARTNDAQELQSDEFYNGPDQRVYGWEWVNGTDRYRFVGTGIARGPLDTIISGTLTLASGPAFGNVIFGLPDQPQEACCYGNMGGAFYPKKTFAYKNLDLRIAKDFHLPWGHEFEVSFAAFNVFDWVNRSYSAWGAGSGIDPTFEENGTVGNARSFQVGAKYSF